MSKCEICGDYAEFRFCSQSCYYEYLSHNEFFNSDKLIKEIKCKIVELRKNKTKRIKLSELISLFKTEHREIFPLVLLVCKEMGCRFAIGGVELV